ncbi:hypothetical protein HJG53_13775 [Sphingomonas sp. ID1715]|uniref:hypothetical protein n=1 Tax=Sphingomonas sp. ID1715 TaxID=1656898 RepID=UPI001487E2AB|nr:hypothetical protein [Sphingomonas sp. ID1715]NNM77972.1 hypothetical protein [Sphingomonas sp. ID1715]
MAGEPDPKSVVAAAAARFFRSYESHCENRGEDGLFALLNAMHSLADKLSRLGRPNLNASQNYLALRALRNLFHHESELLHDTRSLAAGDVPQIHTDLAILCLVPKASVDRALQRARDDERSAIGSALHWYGLAVNIEPAIFNVMVDAYELLQDKGIEPDDGSFARFDSQYHWETAHGQAHRVTGALLIHVGDIDTVLQSLLAAPIRTES